MDKNEVIILSSDEESDLTNCLERNSSSTKVKPFSYKSSEFLKSHLLNSNKNKNMGVIIKNNNTVSVVKRVEIVEKKFKKENCNETPELVDLVDCVEKPSQAQYSNHDTNKTVQDHSKLEIICIDEDPAKSVFPHEKKSDIDISMNTEPRKVSHDIPLEVVAISKENTATDAINSNSPLLSNNETKQIYNKTDEDKVDFNQNLQSFTEFVEYCGFLEKIPNDRAKLTKKLMKRYGEADYNYIKSQEFRNLIQKCRDKVNTHNLYLIAKEITDELIYNKKIEIRPGKSTKVNTDVGNPQSVVENNEGVKQISGKRFKNRTKFINKIIKNLDKLGNKIRELEEKEVDLSDEEESTYVMLQRYRERFCQIYSKLCKYTNDVTHAERFFRWKICFTESKYPAIAKCIENWLNKTKRFPDFMDIMKLLESQSSSFGLPSNRDSIRAIAIEIFQEVGAMLKRRRTYDLWDSFCGFLDEGDSPAMADPATSDPALDEILKKNFEARIEKEQKIFQHYVELQEKEQLEPEEVPDEEANRSPVESGNEDHEEIEDIENLIHKKLDDAIEKETGEIGNTLENNTWSASGSKGCDLVNKTQTQNALKLQNTNSPSKETKNDFKNCKSLKWRSERGGKMICNDSEEYNAETESEKEKGGGNSESDIEVTKPDNSDSKEKREKLAASENVELNSKEVGIRIQTDGLSTPKRPLSVEDQDENNTTPKKKKCLGHMERDVGNIGINDKNDLSSEKEKVFSVHHCQIFTVDVFESLNERKKDWGKRKVFRDLTNVSRLMELHGREKKMSGLYYPSFFHRGFREFEKSSWKKRFKMNFRMVGLKDQKCALSQEEKSEKIINSDKNMEKKNIQNNSESGRNGEGDSFFSGHGNGSEEDNNGDKNKKNGGSTGDVSENQFEEDEDEEENETEKDDSKIDAETTEVSFPNKKTEGSPSTKGNGKTPSEIQNNSNQKSIKLPNPWSETASSGQSVSGKEENKNESEKVFFAENRSERKNQKNDRLCNKSKGECNSDVKSLENEDEKKSVEIEYKKNLPENVRRNSNVNSQNVTVQSEKCNSVKQEARRSSDVVLNENVVMEIEPDISQSLIQVKDVNELITKKKERKKNSFGGNAEVGVRKKTAVNLKKNENTKGHQTVPHEIIEIKPDIAWKSLQLDMTNQKLQRKNTPSKSDEEIVKRFLMSSPASISITPPRRLSFSKAPSQAALQALATLRNLKDISATVVRGKPKNEEEVVVIGGSYKRGACQNSNPSKSRRSDLPVISSVQSIDSTTPKIVTVQGNVSGFENSWPETSNSSSSIKISNVWGNLPDDFVPIAPKIESYTSGHSSRQSDPGSSNSVKKKTKKKTVEYVVIE